MKTRTLTGLVIIAVYVAIVLLAIYVHEVFFDIFVLGLMLFGVMEMSGAVMKRFSPPLIIFPLIYIIASYLLFQLLYHFTDTMRNPVLFSFLAVFAALIIFIIIYSKTSKNLSTGNTVSTLMVIIYPVSVLSYMLALNYLNYPFRQSAILLIFLVPSLSDTFAYLIGSTLKGPKLCPKISPKKTISGAVGGLIGGLAAGGVLILFSYQGWLNVSFISKSAVMNIINFLILGLFGSVFTQMGDIIASFIKRTFKIKDFSSILPGHGGILDRVDGTMFAAIFFYLYMAVLMIL